MKSLLISSSTTLSQKDGYKLMKCTLYNQKNVDGAINQFEDFICVDCFFTGEAKFSGRKAKVLSPVPGYDYSNIDFKKTKDAYNK